VNVLATEQCVRLYFYKTTSSMRTTGTQHTCRVLLYGAYDDLTGQVFFVRARGSRLFFAQPFSARFLPRARQ